MSDVFPGEKHKLYICDVIPLLTTLIEQIEHEIRNKVVGEKTPEDALDAILARAMEAKEKADKLPVHVVHESQFKNGAKWI